MKALTIRQPWATLIAEGVKTIETRWLERRTGYWLEISSMQAWLTRRRYRRTERKQARK